MLNYEIINDIQQVRRRMKEQNYGHRYGNLYGNHSYDGDRLHEFTHAPEAIKQSRANLDLCLEVAQEYGQSLVVIKPYMIQVAGMLGRQINQVSKKLFSDQWLENHSGWMEASRPTRPMIESMTEGEMAVFHSYRPCLCLNEHQGVYDVATGKRLTNRRNIIERVWDLGFAVQRGRPPAIAKSRWTGSREELELITQLADQHWHRQPHSEAAKKMVSTFRSINRYAAWPGAW